MIAFQNPTSKVEGETLTPLVIPYSMNHWPGPVDLALVVDLDFNLDFPADGTKAAKLALLVVIVGRVKLQGIMKLSAATGRMKENCC